MVTPTENPAEKLLRRYTKAKERRSVWEAHWRECYDYALPQRDSAIIDTVPGEKKTDNLFDATAPTAVDQLAASLLAQLTPPWGRWFGLAPGPGLNPEEKKRASALLDRTGEILRSHFDRSNFAMEMHQCYLDLVTVGTASLLFEEAPLGESSAFRFTAAPLSEVVLEEGPSGRPDTTFRRSLMTLAALKARFPEASFPPEMERTSADDPDRRHTVIEAVTPEEHGYGYAAFVSENHGAKDSPILLREGRFASSPFINFRWLKAPGEVYGRSPVMRALPDIKTVNKVVELILKNATISVTGIWQADDDGVLNPATIRLTPGAIIPKAVGSSGLQPLKAPGSFDTSQLVLKELRDNIRIALLGDKLGQPGAPTMTATEVLERAAEMARILGATYGRLQSELLTPLILRAVSILRRRGEIEPLRIDGRTIDLQYRSPLALAQARQDAEATLSWVSSISPLGGEAMAAVDMAGLARWLAESMGVPSNLLRPSSPATPGAGLPDMSALMTSLPRTADGASLDLTALETMLKEALGPQAAVSPLPQEVTHEP